MRRSLFILLAAAALLIGCEPETYLFIDEKPLSFSSDGGSATIDLVANKDWSATSDNGWCTVSPSSGAGDVGGTRLTVQCSKNDSYDSRTATITVRCEDVMKQVSVSQSQSDVLMISQKEFSLDEKGGTITITVQANVTYTCEVIEGSTWIVPIGAKGLSTQTRQFSVKENTKYDDRKGRIRFSNAANGLNEEVVVHQAKKGAIIISQKEFNVGSEGGNITVEVKSNLDYKYQIIEGSNWISAIDTKGLSTRNIQFSIKENTSYDDREGRIRFSDSTTGLSEDVVVHQSLNGAILITQKEYNVGSDGGTIMVEVKSNLEYKYQIIEGSNWISAIGTKGLSTKNIQFSIKENTSYDDREGKIRFSDSSNGLSDTVFVKQSRKGVIIIEKTEYELSYEAQSLEVSLLENTAYEVKISTDSQGWIKKVETKGLQTSSFTLSIEENEQKDREGVVYVTTSTDVITLKIRQADGTITIPDANFRQYCIDNFDKKGDGALSRKEAREVGRINVITDEIESLQGIEYFINLRVLSCRGSGWNSSQQKYIYGKLRSLDISKNVALRELSCYYNELTSLDVSRNTALTYLSCYSNQLTSLDVSRNTALTYLSCNSNQLTSLDVSRNTALQSLSCYSNQLTSLDVSRNTALQSLSCYSNQLTLLDVRSNTSLTYLDCTSNKLNSLDVSRNTALQTLYCSSNQLTSLDVSRNTALQSLSCYSNQLTSLDVSRNTALQSLSCYSNQLTSLDVSRNTALQSLYCSSNQLTSLDVRSNTSLTYLECGYNKLTSLDVSRNRLLETLYCYMSSLTDLYLANGQTFINQNWSSGTRVHYK